MRRHIAALITPLLVAGIVHAGERADLKVTRVAVFSSGVAYFECEGVVRDSAQAELSFRTSQINDIIKSLIVQDLGGGSVGVVSYASQDPLEKTLKSFGVDLTGKPTLGGLLDQLRGEAVEISGARNLSGSIVGVEKQKATLDKGVVEYDVLNVLTEAGIQQLRISELGGIRLTNAKLDAELRKALAALATSHDADKRTIGLEFDGKGERRVRVAYLLEAPIWKTTYRLALDDKGKPFLQGWATVENATEDDWRDVNLSLVSGRPISFTMDLYTPIYIPRPREELELYGSLRPPTFEGGFAQAEAAPAEKAMSLGRRAAARGRDAAGLEMKAVPAAAPPPAPATLGESGVESAAKAQSAGELFEYTIKTPVSVGRQHSAMLQRLIAYALDLAVEIDVDAASHPEEITSLRIVKGVLTYKNRLIDERTYAIKNKDRKDRTVILEQAHSDDWKLVEPKEAMEKTGGLSRFKVASAAGKTSALKVVFEQMLEQSVGIAPMNADQIRMYINMKSISAKVKEALERVVQMKKELDDVTRQRTLRETEANEAVAEQARIRENIKTLQAGSDLYRKQEQKFDESDKRIDALRTQVAELRAAENQRRSALESYLLSLDVE
ncbi:MAG: hypothetical protein HZB38_07330 [Planctomycetes bacterium]|nr:hypothetical protein [Planctomycetota bacterium]